MSRFARTLRRYGFPAGPDAVLDGLRALRRLDLARREDVRAALRAVFVDAPERVSLFDELFDRFWSAMALAPLEPDVPPEERRELGLADDGAEDGEPQVIPVGADDDVAGDDDAAPVESVVYTPREVPLHRDARLDTGDVPELRRLAERVARRLATRFSRRTRPARRGIRPDLRRSLRSALRHGGDVVELTYQARRIRRTRLTVLCDISGSMEVYARFLLQFVYALQHVIGSRVESFVFSTRLQRITPSLRDTDPQLAIARAVAAAAQWGGGTRIGRCLADFYQQYGRDAVDGDTVLIILSDGLDTGDVSLLAEQMKRLQRQARRVIWLNPLAGDVRYEPLAMGMRAALPYVDVLAPAHNLESLLALERYL
ncbi:MAG TPA: VWA domain-containing protein [Bacillota bacterium]